ncbi:hypothetical protein AB6N24_17855 [Cellulomonas sp. 179-A 4D5 NHS]|uniref:hypothetical protein n=1 Tax=Cellulomonas sp. 179-A 4D5 NHS TaxID=3142378 RepID=UPI0039A27E27
MDELWQVTIEEGDQPCAVLVDPAVDRFGVLARRSLVGLSTVRVELVGEDTAAGEGPAVRVVREGHALGLLPPYWARTVRTVLVAAEQAGQVVVARGVVGLSSGQHDLHVMLPWPGTD